MSMNGIDVSNWQKGINLAAVPADFVIMKATEGTGYVSPDCSRQYQQAKAAGRCLGVYHYANGGSVQAEADFFLKNVRGYIGEAILVLDWESQNNPLFGKNDFNWCKQWCDYVYRKTGVKPLVYIQKSAMGRIKGIGDYGLWIAQYANDNATGYQEMPWNEGAYSCVMRQYSSAGRLSGYSGNLDLNKFYGDKTAWNKYAGGGKSGWVKDSVGWWYRYADGSYPKNKWLKLDTWYYFDEKGYALCNEWIHYKNKWYYLRSDCRMAASEWQKVDGYWYYLGADGAMLDGWQKIHNKWYYLDPDGGDRPHGAMVTGAVAESGHDYMLKESGEMITGWYQTEEDWYYYNESNNCQPIGSMMRNHWQGKYYLKDDGRMAYAETLIIGGKEYAFAEDGKVKQ